MSNAKIEFLDFAKGYAIFSIVLFHVLQLAGLSPLLQKMIFFGGTGVHLFFLLSGYGLGLSKGKVEALSFYKRRASKIWLPYVLILTISMICAYAFGVFPDRWEAWAAGVGLYQMFMEPFVASYGGHFWFISAIMQLYIAYPIIKYCVDKAGGHTTKVILGAVAISALWWMLVYFTGNGSYRIWNSFFLQFLWEFVLGLALASALKSSAQINLGFALLRPDFWNTTWLKALLVGGFFSAIMLFMALKMGAFGKIYNDIPALLGYTGICVMVYQIGLHYLPFVKQFFMWISGFSFSLYLVHMLGFQFYQKALAAIGMTPNLLTLMAYIPIALALGWLYEPLSQWWTNQMSALFFDQKTTA
jgi:peptidoglycan/LPS O-acetylase OafA/YrhL